MWKHRSELKNTDTGSRRFVSVVIGCLFMFFMCVCDSLVACVYILRSHMLGLIRACVRGHINVGGDLDLGPGLALDPAVGPVWNRDPFPCASRHGIGWWCFVAGQLG